MSFSFQVNCNNNNNYNNNKIRHLLYVYHFKSLKNTFYLRYKMGNYRLRTFEIT